VQKKAQECWLWVALCRRTRQIVAYTVGFPQPGGRHEPARTGARGLPPSRHARATSGWPTRAAFPQRTHRLCGKEQGETNHAEGFFGTLRARLSRLVRKTYSFSKCIECHLDAIHLFITSYNLGIKQSTGG
jgi:IS1 family transposase